jgi:hypothetical protein
MMRLSESVKFGSAFGAGRTSSIWSSSPPAAAAAALVSASGAALASWIFLSRLSRCVSSSGSSSPRRSRPYLRPFVRAVVSYSRISFNLLLQPLLCLLQARVAHRLVLARVRVDLRAVDRDVCQLHDLGTLAEAKHLKEEIRQRLEMPPPEKSEVVRKSG